jgi:hypothetical protein
LRNLLYWDKEAVCAIIAVSLFAVTIWGYNRAFAGLDECQRDAVARRIDAWADRLTLEGFQSRPGEISVNQRGIALLRNDLRVGVGVCRETVRGLVFGNVLVPFFFAMAAGSAAIYFGQTKGKR